MSRLPSNRQVTAAVNRKDAVWLVKRLGESHKITIQSQYTQMVLLMALERSRMWVRHPLYKNVSWPQFVKAMCHFTVDRYQHLKTLIKKYGHKTFEEFGAENCNVIAGSDGPKTPAIIREMRKFSIKNGKIPSPSWTKETALRMTNQPRHAYTEVVVDAKDNYKELYLELKENYAKLRRQNVILEAQNRRLTKQLHRFTVRTLAKSKAITRRK